MTNPIEPTQADIDAARLFDKDWGEFIYLEQRIELAKLLARHRIEACAEKDAVILKQVEDMKAMANALLGEIERLINLVEELEVDNAWLRDGLVAEREENLWNAYNSGHTIERRWSHRFMADGEWLVRECGLDTSAAYQDDDVVRKAIPIAARKALGDNT